MRKTVFFAMAVAAMALASCNKNSSELLPQTGTTISLGIDNPATKTLHAGAVEMLWADGDCISVAAEEGIKTMALTEGAGTSSAKFHIDETVTIGSSAAAFYPETLNPTWKDDAWYVTLPKEYEWADAAIQAPLSGWINNGDYNVLSMITGVIKIDVEDVPDGGGQLIFTTNGRKVYGEFAIDSSSDAVSTSESAEGNTIIINYPTGLPTDNLTFYVPVPAGDYNGFTVSIVNSSNEIVVSKTVSATVSVSRNKIIFAPAFSCSNSKAVTAWEGSLSLTWSDGGRVLVPVSYFQAASAGDVLSLYYSQVSETWGQAQINNAAWTVIKFSELGEAEVLIPTDVYGWSFGDRCTQFVLTQDILDNIIANANWAEDTPDIGLIIQGSGLTFTKVEIGTTPAPESILWTGNHDLGSDSSWADAVAVNAKGLNAASFWNNLSEDSVLTIYFTENASPGYVNILIKSNTDGWPQIDGLEYNTGAVGANSTSFTLTEAQVDAIKEYGIIIQGIGAVINKITLR